MQLTVQKRIASSVLKCSEKRIKFDTERMEDIKEAITKEDIRVLINDGAIIKLPVRGVSRVRANERLEQRRKGSQRGHGSHKGKRTARIPSKQEWMEKVRAQRAFLKRLKEADHLTTETHRNLYNKSKGGFFRSCRHIKIYIEEHDLAKKSKSKNEA